MQKKKDGIFVNAKIRRDLVERLNEHAEQTELSKTVILERALRLYFDHIDGSRAAGPRTDGEGGAQA